MEQIRKKRSKARTNLNNGAFASSRSAGANRNGCGKQLDRWNARPDIAILVMIGGDCGIGPVPFRFRRVAEK